MNRQHFFLFGILILVIIILLGIIIFRKQIVEMPSNDKIYKDSINMLQSKIDSSYIRQKKLQEAYDSLCTLDPSVIYRTRDKIHFIYSNATADELDSIIRSTWKTKSRYR